MYFGRQAPYNVARCIIMVSVLYLAISTEGKAQQHHGLLCVDTNANTSLRMLQGSSRIVLDGRRASGVFYFFKLADVIGRTIRMGDDGKLELVSTPWEKSVSIHAFRAAGMDQETVKSELVLTAASYRNELQRLSKVETEKETTPLPFVFLGAKKFATGGPTRYESPDVMAQIHSAYRRNPSSTRALIYLELAMIEMEMGMTNSLTTLESAIATLGLTNLNYRADADFRRQLHPSLNFARPECAILYLAGKGCEGENMVRAIHYYTCLLRNAPSSPCAWEAASRLVRLASCGVEIPELEILEELLAQVYPVIWGASRESVALEEENVAEEIRSLLKTVADEIKDQRPTVDEE